MRIKRIKIENFRSIERAEIHVSDFNIAVGQNNHGKTNFFEAINWFYSATSTTKDLKFKQKNENHISMEIEFEGIQSGIDQMSNENQKKTIKSKLGDLNSVTIIKTSDDRTGHKKRFFIEGEIVPPGTGFDTALNQFLPKLEYVDTKIRLEDVSKYKTTSPIGQMLSSVLTAIIEEGEEYQNFKNEFSRLFEEEDSPVRAELNVLSSKVEIFLKKQFPDGTKVNFAVESPAFDDLLKNFETEIDDGIKTTAAEKGDGMQRALMLAIIQAYAEFRKERNIERSFLFLIDEAELHLHPSGQRKLKEVLFDITKEGDQVFINTHSSVLVADEEENQKIFKVQKVEKVTSIKEIAESEKPSIVYELLGGSPNDLLLPRNFLIVEGPSELYFLSSVIERFYGDKPSIQIIFAEGDYRQQEKTMNGINKVFLPLYGSPIYKDKLIILCDLRSGEKEEDFNSFKESYSYLEDQEQIFILPVSMLEQYYPEPWRIKDIDWKEKVVLAERVGKEIEQEQFETEMEVIFGALKKCWDNAY